MEIAVYNTQGQVVKNLSVSEAVFGVPMNDAVVHQALVAQAANARQGTQSTKGRSEVAGSSKKLFRQKGTGEARAGSIKSGLRPGGGIMFGPKPRDFGKALPKKVRQLAIRCLLSDKFSSGGLKVVEGFNFETPRTKDMAALLSTLECSPSAIVATAGVDQKVVLSARNLPKVKTTPANLLNVVDLMKYDKLVLTEEALVLVEKVWGGEAV
ncbi:large subunit ribosomal protein L4 [Dehalogenimonas formicexedens]|uniref:Large ribosomal subunit protein uL4 n=1 Tax=Dehalogenimonas formicexedens TaxID=1839801 RepID=A0A1P8F501_9CHLR|nr:50S ribosomal protein L4 [Dehalogenimonas formicexedens]APV43556.1 large subunit ribosomal protein L4 [Dehalogenimonas formicexedens]